MNASLQNERVTSIRGECDLIMDLERLATRKPRNDVGHSRIIGGHLQKAVELQWKLVVGCFVVHFESHCSVAPEFGALMNCMLGLVKSRRILYQWKREQDKAPLLGGDGGCKIVSKMVVCYSIISFLYLLFLVEVCKFVFYLYSPFYSSSS
jgi:hypothetical protein